MTYPKIILLKLVCSVSVVCQHTLLELFWSVSVAYVPMHFWKPYGLLLWHTSTHTLKIIWSVSVAGIKIHFWSSYGLFLWHMSTYTSETDMVCFCGMSAYTSGDVTICFCEKSQHILLELLQSISVDCQHTILKLIWSVSVACQHTLPELLHSVSVAYVRHTLLDLLHSVSVVCQHTSQSDMVCFCGMSAYNSGAVSSLFLLHMSPYTSQVAAVRFCGICKHTLLKLVWSVSVACQQPHLELLQSV